MAKDFTRLRLFDPDSQRFGDLNLDSWIKQNKIRERAHESGLNEFPPTESAANDQFPPLIRTWVGGEAANCRAEVIKTLGALEESMKNQVDPVALEQQTGESELITKQSSLEINKLESLHKANLETPKRHREEIKQELAEFKSANGLHRVADFSHRSNAIFWILVCALIEILLNATLLMEVSETGLLGSFFLMVLIASVNILTGACIMGPVLRRINHIKIPVKTLGVVVSFVVFVAIVAWNFFVGHFRDELWALQEAIATLPEDASFQELLAVGSSGAIERFQESPIGLDSFHSFLLVLNGLLFFSIAMVKGYQYDDAYPHYGKKTRLNQKIEDYFLTECKHTVNELENVYLDAKDKLEKIRSNISNRQRFYNGFRSSGARILESYGVKFNQYEDVLQATLKAYCASNAEARSSDPPKWPALNLDPGLLIAPEFNPPKDVDLVSTLHEVEGHLDSLMKRYELACQDFARADWQIVAKVDTPP